MDRYVSTPWICCGLILSLVPFLFSFANILITIHYNVQRKIKIIEL